MSLLYLNLIGILRIAMLDLKHQEHTKKESLEASLKLKIVDSTFETVFDSITKVASEICGTPIAIISLIDDKRQWFIANVGFGSDYQPSKEVSFCTHTIQNDVLLEVPDATQDDRFMDNPLVTGNPEIRFYCGAPIKLPMGEIIGSLCVIDTVTRYLNETQRIALKGLANVTADLLVAREVNICSRTKETTLDFI